MKDTIYRENAIEVIRAWFETTKLNPDILIDGIIALPSADKLQGNVDAVAILMREMHNLDQGYITIGEFDERIEPLRHLCYGRPQGEWLKFGLGRGTRILFCTNCERRIEVPLSQGDSNYDFCPNCGAKMFVKDINVPNKKRNR